MVGEDVKVVIYDIILLSVRNLEHEMYFLNSVKFKIASTTE